MYIYNNPRDFIEIFKTCKLCSNKIIDEKEDKYTINGNYIGNFFHGLNMKKISVYKNNLIIDKIESGCDYKKNYYGDNNIIISHSCIFNINCCVSINIVLSEKTNSIKRVIPNYIDFFEPFTKKYYSLFKFLFLQRNLVYLKKINILLFTIIYHIKIVIFYLK